MKVDEKWTGRGMRGMGGGERLYKECRVVSSKTSRKP